jgi:hypothetical protein
MSSSKKWVSATGDPEITKVHTPFTLRSKELKNLLVSLYESSSSQFDVKTRLDILNQVKLTVSEFDCILTRDIVELMEREETLLLRGRGEKSIAGLRERLNNLFLQFVETPEFNPEAARLQV